VILPTLSQLDGAASTRIWLATEPADMRCGFDRLAQRAAAVTGQDPLGGHLFLFRSKGGDRIKILYFDRDGYALWYKRLEEGTFKWPKMPAASADGSARAGVAAPAASVELRGSELAMILDGIDLSSIKRGKRYRRGNIP
jgi:transposase